MVWEAPDGPEMVRLTRQKVLGLGFIFARQEWTFKKTTKGIVAQLYLGSTPVAVAAREARAGFGFRVAITRPPRTSRKTTKGTVAQLYLGPTVVTIAARLEGPLNFAPMSGNLWFKPSNH